MSKVIEGFEPTSSKKNILNIWSVTKLPVLSDLPLVLPQKPQILKAIHFHFHNQKEDFVKHLKGIFASTCKYSLEKRAQEEMIFHTSVISVEDG